MPRVEARVHIPSNPQTRSVLRSAVKVSKKESHHVESTYRHPKYKGLGRITQICLDI